MFLKYFLHFKKEYEIGCVLESKSLIYFFRKIDIKKETR